MKFDYEVKHNGRIYPAGTDVPVGVIVNDEAPVIHKFGEETEKPKPRVTPKKKTKK